VVFVIEFEYAGRSIRRTGTRMTMRILPCWQELRAVAVAAFLLAANGAWAAAIGDPAPAFSLPDGRGGTLALEQLHGQVVYVDFWASWCAPCRRSFPWMNEMQQRYGGRGLAIVAINVDAKREDALRFLRKYPADFAVVYDGTGATPGAYEVKAMPSSFLVDAQGRIAAIELGFLDARRAAIEHRIRSLIESRQ
jgi:thiol-disulfide isomerase/thioredoxin